MKRFIPILILIIALLSSLTTATLAWLAKVTVNKPEIDGSVFTGYFSEGDGKKENPYLLETPTHIYNLAWLQYIGYFNSITDTDGKIIQTYFKLVNDIDMMGTVIPPIGTEDEPFLGNFNGNNKKISNVTISNYTGTSDDPAAIVDRPLTVTDMGQTASIIGFFGVIGDYKQKYGDKIVNDAATTEISSKVNSVYDLYLDNITVRTETQQSLIGLLAGYANGSIANVGVGKSSIEIGENVLPMSEPEAVKTLKAISLWSLVGAIDLENVVWKELPGGSIPGGNTGEAGSGFGGSLEMMKFAQRITYMYSANAKDNKVYPLTNYSQYASNAVSDYARLNYKKTGTAYLGAGTILPLNVNTDIMFAESYEENGQVIANTELDIGTPQGSNYPYYTNSYYRNHSSELVLPSNTGYIVGAGSATNTSGAMVRVNVAELRSNVDKIDKSINDVTGKDENNKDLHKVIDSTLELLTIIPSKNAQGQYTSQTKVITSNASAQYAVGDEVEEVYSPTNFIRYSDVFSDFVDSFNYTPEEGSYRKLSGLRFYVPTSGDGGIDLSKILSSDAETKKSVVTTANVNIYGNSLNGYEMINGAINFNLKNDGFITAIAGTYTQEADHSLFTLYQVERTNGKITDAYVIEDVWVKYETVDGEKKIKDIKYNNELDDTTGYTLVYSSSEANNLTIEHAAYYFEIPVRSGDYVIGAEKESKTGAYLLYLDIGANGDIGTGGGQEGTVGKYEHSITGVKFVDAEGISAKTTADYSMVTYRITIPDTATSSHSGAVAKFNRTSKTAMDYSFTDSSAKLKLEVHSDDAGLTVTKKDEAQLAYLQVKKTKEETG